MIQRSKERTEKGERCNVFAPWKENYLVFKEWAMNNGYSDDLVLCRNGDKGDYVPHNVRFATKAENLVEAKSKYWQVSRVGTGKWITVYNLSKFCRKHNLTQSALSLLASGDKRASQHKGWTCRKAEVIDQENASLGLQV